MTETSQKPQTPSNRMLAGMLFVDVRRAVFDRQAKYKLANALIQRDIAAGTQRPYGKRRLCLSVGDFARHGEALLQRRRCHHELMYLVPLTRHLRRELSRGVRFEDRDSREALAWKMTPLAVSALNLAGDIATDLVDRYASLVMPYMRPGRMPLPSRLDLMQEPHLSRRKQALYAKVKTAVALTLDEDFLLRGALALAPESQVLRRLRTGK